MGLGVEDRDLMRLQMCLQKPVSEERSQIHAAVPQAATVQYELKNVTLPDERKHLREQIVAWRQKRNAMLDSVLQRHKQAKLASKAVASLLLTKANERAKIQVRSLWVARAI
jgi:type II secretory pathway component PulJ